jgi:16S rRNA processing protein RimM
LKELQLHQAGKSHVFEIAKLKPFKRGFIASLKGFSDRNKAEEFKGAEVWVDESLFVSEDGESLYLNEIAGFSVHDKTLGDIGQISDFSSNGIQDLLVIQDKSESFEIPFVKEYVLDIDFKNKTIKMDLPEGLLEINQNDEN